MLAKKSGAVYIGTGSLFRGIAKEDTEFGRYIKDLIDNGLLASDADVEKVLHQQLDSLDKDRTVIFDGVPRRLSQAEFLISYLHLAGTKDIVTFYITLPREESLHRMGMRRVCNGCDQAISITDEAEAQKACERCGGSWVQRNDDTPEAINKRLDIYYRDTMPVIDFLKEHSDFHQIDGTKHIDEVEAQIDQILGIH